MTSSGLRIRDLSLPLTKHKRSLIDGSIEPEAEKSENYLYLEARKLLVQCRFITPIRGVSALSVPTTDRAPIKDIKVKLLEKLHDLPEPNRPPDSVLALHGSRYYQRRSVQNDFKVSITNDPEQLIFFIDEQDTALSDDATLFELGYESSPPLISVYCATDHVWLRLRGFPERYSVPWHLHMTECELAKEVYGLLKPRDMRMVRAVFYKDEEALKMHRKYRRPATEAPPMWKSGSHFGKYETEDSSSTNNNNYNHNSSNSSLLKPLQPTVIPLHEWCQIPPPPNTKINPAHIFEDIRREAAQIRAEMIHEALMQARDSWFEVPDDVALLAETEGALKHIPKWLHVTRMRDGRDFCFRTEVFNLAEQADQHHRRNENNDDDAAVDAEENEKHHRHSRQPSSTNKEAVLETNVPIGDLAEAVVHFCTTATNKTGITEEAEDQNQSDNEDDDHDSDEYARINHNNDEEDEDRRRSSLSKIHQLRALRRLTSESRGEGDEVRRQEEEDHQHRHKEPSSSFSPSSLSSSSFDFETKLLSWIPHLVSTGNILENGEEERLPHAHPQLFLPFDDDDEEVSPFGCKEIHSLWNVAEMLKKYPFLEQDYFFHRRRAKESVELMREILRSEVIRFLNEPLQFTFNPPNRGSGTTRSRYEAENPSVEFDNVSLPRHLSDYGIYNGAEVYIEHFSIHAQSWSNDVAQEAHESMKSRLMMPSSAVQHGGQQHQLHRNVSNVLPKNVFQSESQTNSWSLSTTFDVDPITESNKPQQQSSRAISSEVNRRTSATKNSNHNNNNNNNSSTSVIGIQFTSASKNQQQQKRNLLDDEITQRQHMSDLRKKKAMQLQLSKRQREDTVRKAGFSFVNVRSARGTLFRVPVIYETALVQDILDLIFCATGDIPMFSIVVGPRGDLLAPWAPLKEIERNPGLLSLRILRRPRAWLQETVETVARDASRLAPHLD